MSPLEALLESVDECLPPMEKETSDGSMSGFLAQQDNYKRVRVLTMSDLITIQPLFR
jgi:hypothetical protein